MTPDRLPASVVIPARDAPTLADCLAALAVAQPAPAEVIVVDDGSEPPIEVGAYRLLRVPEPHGPAHARNLGAGAASQPFLCFVDADVVVAPKTLGRLLGPLRDGATATQGLYSRSCPHSDFASRYENLIQRRNFEHLPEPDIDTLFSYCVAMRRAVFLQMGGFDESVKTPSVEDGDFGLDLRRAGHRIVLVREAEVEHLKRYTAWGVLRRRARIGFEKAAGLLAHPGRLLARRTPHGPAKMASIVAAPLAFCGTWAAAAVAALLLTLNRDLVLGGWRQYGLAFGAGAAVFLWLDCLAAGAGLAVGAVRRLTRPRRVTA